MVRVGLTGEQSLTEVLDKGIDKDILDGERIVPMTIEFPSPFRLTYVAPISSMSRKTVPVQQRSLRAQYPYFSNQSPRILLAALARSIEPRFFDTTQGRMRNLALLMIR